MTKTTLGNRSLLYPYPVTIVGATVDGKPNFMTIGFIGIVNSNPGMLALGSNRSHFTNKGIFEHGVFSVNIPSDAMVEATDYVGMKSGASVDKSGVFDVFYGKLEKAPMISACPLSLECRLVQTLELGGHDHILIGEIVESYADEAVLTDGLPDVEKMRPFVFSMYDNRYFAIGKTIAKAWDAGKNYVAK